MKISKVNHTRAAVSAKKEENVKGVLYHSPKLAKDMSGLEDLSRRIDKLNRAAKTLYNLFIPIQEGVEPKEPKRDAINYDNKIENYRIKKNNYDSRKKYVRCINDINKTLGFIIFSKDNRNNKVMNKDDVIISNLSKNNFRKSFNKKEYGEIVALALRTSIANAKLPKGKDGKCPIENVAEGAVSLLLSVGQDSISEAEKDKIKAFLEIVRADFNYISNNKDRVIRSIDNQNLVVQAGSESFALPVPDSVGKSKKTKNYKISEKEALSLFLNAYADLNKDNRMAILRKLRRLVDLYFATPKSLEGFALPDAVDTSDFNVWEKHEQGKACKDYFAKVPEKLLENYNGKNASNVFENKSLIAELNSNIRNRNIACYRFSIKCVEENAQYFFDNEALNKMWIHHIESAIERIMKHRVTNNLFKLEIGYLREKIWADLINYISLKYVALGKTVFNFGMEELNTDSSEINLGIVSENIKKGISSFDLEIIKARENLQRDCAVHLAFAANNLARATVKLEEGKEDFLLLSEKEMVSLVNRDSDLMTNILQFFGGKSAWDLAIFDVYEDKTKFLFDLKEIIYALRNENFHFTTSSINKGSWNTELVGKMFEKDIEACISIEKNKFYSNNLPLFYKEEDLKKALDTLYSKTFSRAAQIPSFNSVLTRKNLPEFMSNIMKYKKPAMDSKKLDKWYSACYYLYKEIYYNGFLQSEASMEYAKKAVNDITAQADNTFKHCNQNDRAAVNDAKGKQRAANDFSNRFNEINAKSLAELCQAIMTEYNYQNNQRKVKTSTPDLFDTEIFKHYKYFLLELLKRAFAEYIKKEEVYSFIAIPDVNKSEMMKIEDFLPNWKSEMYNSLVGRVNKTSELQKWYIAGRFMNAKSLNLLAGSMRSYIQYVSDVKKRAEIVNADLHLREKERVKSIKEIIKVIDVCIKLSSKISNNITDYFKDNESYAAYLAKYVKYTDDSNVSYSGKLAAFCNKYGYNEGNNSYGIYMDEKNPIVNRNVVMAKLYGADSILSKVIDQVKDKDLDEYFKLEKSIAAYKVKNKCSNKDEQQKLIDFQRLKNRVELRDVTEYGEVINELLGQLINWSYLRERDLLYYQLGFHYSCLNNDSAKPEIYKSITYVNGEKEVTLNNAILYMIMGLYINGIGEFETAENGNYSLVALNGSAGAKIKAFSELTSKGMLLSADNNKYYIYEAGLEIFEKLNEHDNVVELRNAIDHFKYYFTAAPENKIDEIEYLNTGDAVHSILDYYSEIFDRFFTYDMKYRKNVVNLLGNILLRHNIILDLGINKATKVIGTSNKKKSIKAATKDRANIFVKKIESDKYTYKIGDGADYKTNAKDKRYLSTIVKLLYYPYECPDGLIK